MPTPTGRASQSPSVRALEIDAPASDKSASRPRFHRAGDTVALYSGYALFQTFELLHLAMAFIQVLPDTHASAGCCCNPLRSTHELANIVYRDVRRRTCSPATKRGAFRPELLQSPLSKIFVSKSHIPNRQSTPSVTTLNRSPSALVLRCPGGHPSGPHMLCDAAAARIVAVSFDSIVSLGNLTLLVSVGGIKGSASHVRLQPS
jgi:hypothetical protein